MEETTLKKKVYMRIGLHESIILKWIVNRMRKYKLESSDSRQEQAAWCCQIIGLEVS